MQQLIEVVPPGYSNNKFLSLDVERNGLFNRRIFCETQISNELKMSSTILSSPLPALGTLVCQTRASNNGHQPLPSVVSFHLMLQIH